ncbi:hypothetical protein Tco_0488401 [Tanacetum coccineum]
MTPSALRPPNLIVNQGESSDPHNPNVIRIRRSIQPDPETLIPTAAEIDIASLDEATQMIEEHLVDEEIENIVEGGDNVDEDEFMSEIINNQEDPNTKLEPMNHKESPEVKKSVDVLIINDDEEEESAGDALI